MDCLTAGGTFALKNTPLELSSAAAELQFE